MRRLKAEHDGAEDGDRFDGVDFALPIPQALDEWWGLPFNSFVHDPRLYWTNPEWPPTVRPDPSGYGVADGLPENKVRPEVVERLRTGLEWMGFQPWRELEAKTHLYGGRM